MALVNELRHYTCTDHGQPGIERDGVIHPNNHSMLPELGPVIWLTDLDLDADPLHRQHVGLTSTFIACDRTAVHYAFAVADIQPLLWWPFVRYRCDPQVVADLERYGWCTHWWLTTTPIPIHPHSGSQ